MKSRDTLLIALIGTLILALGLLPITRVPVIGDDFFVLFQSQGQSDGDFFAWVSLAWGWGLQAGHFNPVGQVLGGSYHFFALPITSMLGIAPHHYYVAGSYTLITLSVVAAAYATQSMMRFVWTDSAVPFWRVYGLLATVAGVTVQLHPWSNDPVTTYSMAGFGSAAIAFLLLGMAFSAVQTERVGALRLAAISALSVFAVVYYEMLVAAVAATAVVYVWAIIRPRPDIPDHRRRAVLLVIVSVVLPAVVFVGGRAYVSLVSGTGGYTGTSVALGFDTVRTLAFGMASSLPGGAWPYTLYRVDPIEFGRAAIVTSFVLVLALIALTLIWSRQKTQPLGKPLDLWVPATSLVVLWVLSTLAHAITPKYIAEVSAPGLVYLFYAVGMLVLTVVIAVAVMACRVTRMWRVAFLMMLMWFAVGQQSINWTLSTIMRDAYVVNTDLGGAANDADLSIEARCDRLQSWIDRGWPQYYLDAVVEYVPKSFEQLTGERFCDEALVYDGG